jgi:hypothetical protein
MKIIQIVSDKLMKIAYEPLEQRLNSLESLRSEITSIPEFTKEQNDLFLDILNEITDETKIEIQLQKANQNTVTSTPVAPTIATPTPTPTPKARVKKQTKKTTKVDDETIEDISVIDDILNLF